MAWGCYLISLAHPFKKECCMYASLVNPKVDVLKHIKARFCGTVFVGNILEAFPI